MCGNTIQLEIYNPNKTYKIVKFDRDCGATTGNSTQISIIKASDSLPNDPGNIFIADRDSVEISWQSNYDILIRNPEEMQTFTKDTTFKQFRIRYQNLIILPPPFDSNKTPALITTDIQGIKLLRGEWEWKGKVWNFQADKSLTINDQKNIKKICTAIKTAKLSNNREEHAYWLQVVLLQGKNEIQLIVVKTIGGDFYFDYEDDNWYNGEVLAELLSLYLQENFNSPH
jgi:hypothetical protein